ncbi:MAG: flagellar biosynthesis anti-sigma factor FlgM [Eubacteriales bacterium]|nr:flagellar biosynthesis anti-sigma factor FlgM [Eubacteriales bacterium]
MKINSIPPKELISQYIHVREKTVLESQEPATDKAELTSEAKTFSAALKAAKEAMERTPEELEHISKVANQVENNAYSVSGEEVAKKILGE